MCERLVECWSLVYKLCVSALMESWSLVYKLCERALVESRSLVYSISIVLLLRLPLQHKAGMNGGPDIVYSQQNKTPNKTKQNTHAHAHGMI